MKRVKQLMPLFRRQLSRHQHRSCSLCSKPVENTNNLLDSYRKIQELLTNKDELELFNINEQFQDLKLQLTKS
jgi:hypothetical protein